MNNFGLLNLTNRKLSPDDLNDSNIIVEIKTSIKKNLDDLIELFPFQRIRFSKYCFAVESLKQTG